MKNLHNISKFSGFVLVLLAIQNQVLCFTISYPSFPVSVNGDFIQAPESYIVKDALQVTRDTRGANINNLAGKIVYKQQFKLWNKQRVASFNSSFVLRIEPQPDGGGEGLAFILSKDFAVPLNSEGQWLGIVNASTNGSSDSSIVAIEFDTKKSFPQDIDSNHVGLNINSVYSEVQRSLNSSNIIIGSNTDITAMIIYDGEANIMNLSVFSGNQSTDMPIISEQINLREFLPDKVYVGFSASTGPGSELNCIKSWFFNGTVIDPPKQPMKLWVLIIIIVVSSLVLLICLTGGYLYWMKRRYRSRSSSDENTIQRLDSELMGPKMMKLKDLKAATGNFNAKNELGRGGFGVVYRGTWNGIDVAVKRIKKTAQGKQNLIAEVTSIGSVRHKNVVKLIGWCNELDELLLAYEYMPNGSLDKYIYSSDEKLQKVNYKFLSWETRHKIICGVAQALDYLHNDCSRKVLHRDIKASNIMLDSEFNACLGDFGLARMFKRSEQTHHSTNEIAGTPGYMAPELFHTGRATAETDVFAFGVLVLVVACGKRACFQVDVCDLNNSIADWVWEFYNSDVVIEAIDPKLKENFDEGQGEVMLVLGLACCHPNPHMRPSMRNALQVLMGEALPPMVPYEKPAFVWPAISPSFSREDSTNGGMLSPYSSLTGR